MAAFFSFRNNGRQWMIQKRRRPLRASNNLSFSSFCASLGAPLRVIRKSWSAYSPQNKRAVFTIWIDELSSEGRYVFWTPEDSLAPVRFGSKEIRSNAEAVIENCHEAFGILCEAVDTTAHPRARRRYDATKLVVLQLVREGGSIVGYVRGDIEAAAIQRGEATANALLNSAIDDLYPPSGIELPQHFYYEGSGFVRDDRIRAFVVERAAGKCEYCGQIDFVTVNGEGYIESHHIIALSKQGPDSLQNVIGLCSSHHREAHYGRHRRDLESKFKVILDAINAK